MNQTLFKNINADDISSSFTANGGIYTVNVRADNFGGGTVLIQTASKNDPNGTPRYSTLVNGSFTVNGSIALDPLAPGTLVRAVLQGSSSPSNVFVEIIQ